MVKDEIRQFLLDNHPREGLAELKDDDSLTGLVDSMAVAELIGHLEDTYQVRVTENDMSWENFDSIGAIARFVDEKRSARQPT